MIEMAIGEVFLRAFILCGLIYAFARQEGDYNFQKIAMIMGAIVVADAFLLVTLHDKIGPFTVVPLLAVIVWLLMKFCWLSLKKALLITALFTVCNGVMAAAQAWFWSSAAPEPSPVQKELDDRYKLAVEIVGDLVGDEGLPAPGADAPGGAPAAAPEPMEEIVPEPDAEEAPAPPPPAAAPAVPAQDAGWKASRAKLVISARMTGKDKKMIAVVNGQMISVGSTITVQHEGTIYRWRLAGLTKETVEWQPAGAQKAQGYDAWED